MRLLSPLTLAAIHSVRISTLVSFLLRTVTTVRVQGKADEPSFSAGVPVKVRMAPLELARNPDIALRYKDEPRTLFRVSVGVSVTAKNGDIFEHPTLGTQYEVIGTEEEPTGNAITKYFIVAQVIE